MKKEHPNLETKMNMVKFVGVKRKNKPYDPDVEKSSGVEEPMLIAPLLTKLDFLSGFSHEDLTSKNISGHLLSDLQEETSLNPTTLAEIMGVSKSKFYELLSVESLHAKHLDALADFAVLWKKGIDAFDGDQKLFQDWLYTRNENLGGVRPVSLLSTRLGRRELEKAFMRIEYSVYG